MDSCERNGGNYMIEREIILNYYNYGERYYGSYKGIRFAIERVGEKPDLQLRFTSWPEPFGFDHTDDDKKVVQEFPFSEEGYDSGIAWLNVEYKSKYAKQSQ